MQTGRWEKRCCGGWGLVSDVRTTFRIACRIGRTRSRRDEEERIRRNEEERMDYEQDSGGFVGARLSQRTNFELFATRLSGNTLHLTVHPFLMLIPTPPPPFLVLIHIPEYTRIKKTKPNRGVFGVRGTAVEENDRDVFTAGLERELNVLGGGGTTSQGGVRGIKKGGKGIGWGKRL